MQEEYEALMINKTCELVDLSSSGSIIGNRWLFKIKIKPHKTLDMYKVRPVV